MKIREIFKKRIDRRIESVVKVLNKDDEEIRKIELEEYIITEEVRRNIGNFFSAFSKSLDEPTEDVGVWVLGFFGSGKSHFLKILYYLLKNVEAGGKRALDYFKEKIDDELFLAEIERAAKVPKDVILFEIGSRASRRTKETISETIESVFYNYLGLHTESERVFQVEKYIFKEGKFEQFKEEFRKRTGKDWDKEYRLFLKYEKTIKKILSDILDFPEDFDLKDLSSKLTIESLAKEIYEFSQSRGNDHRIIFLIDEMGQYVGDNTDRMLELQDIVENFGRIGKGKLWIVVTAQEDIESIFNRTRSFDFSKIMDRFKIRLKLSSYSVDEVVKKRILEKNNIAKDMLSTFYENAKYSLENAISFSNASHDYHGYSNINEFVNVYPFVPYQIKLLQRIFEKKREQGIAGQYTPSGERSLLYSFQQVLLRFADADLEERILIPFNSFYDPLANDFSSSVIRVIKRAEENPALDDFDVEVLKLLFLLKDIEEMPANIENITTLMINSTETDKIELREKIIKALEKLQSENLVEKGAKGFVFLTSEEQKISVEIKNVPIDPREISQKILDIFTNDIYPENSIKIERYISLPFSVKVDEEEKTRQKREMQLHLVSSSYRDFERLLLQSNYTLLIKLPEDPEFEEDIEQIVKIEKYLRSRDWSSQPETVRAIIELKKAELNTLELKVRNLLEGLLENAKYFINGNEINPSGSNAYEKIKNALIQLSKAVYTKMNLVKRQYDERDLRKFISNPNLYEEYNIEASVELSEIILYMDNPTMSEIVSRFQKAPHGWPKNFTKAVILTLLFRGEIELLYGNEVLRPSDRGFIDKILKERESERIRIRKKEKLRKEILDSVKSLIHDLFSIIDLPDEQDELAEIFVRNSNEFLEKLKKKLKECESGHYKFCEPLKNGIKLLESLYSNGPSHSILKKASEMSAELLSWKETAKNVLNFFEENSNQKRIFDSGRDIIKRVEDIKDLISIEEIEHDLRQLEAILESESPFGEIPKIPELREKLKQFLDKTLKAEKDKLKKEYLKKIGVVEEEKRESVKEKILQLIEGSKDLKTLYAMSRKFDEIIEEATKQDKKEEITGQPVSGKIKVIKLSFIINQNIIRDRNDVERFVESIKKRLEKEINNGYEIKIEG